MRNISWTIYTFNILFLDYFNWYDEDRVVEAEIFLICFIFSQLKLKINNIAFNK